VRRNDPPLDGGGGRVEVLPAGIQRSQGGRVQVVPQRNAGRDVQADDVRGRHLVQVLDQRPQRVAVGATSTVRLTRRGLLVNAGAGVLGLAVVATMPGCRSSRDQSGPADAAPTPEGGRNRTAVVDGWWQVELSFVSAYLLVRGPARARPAGDDRRRRGVDEPRRFAPVGLT
jgi:hypothetical protein